MSMSTEELQRIQKTKTLSNKIFNFGESTYQSKHVLEIPISINNKKNYVKTEILKDDIPWLIGKETMRRLQMKIDVFNLKASYRCH